jgi:hypothetical protein
MDTMIVFTSCGTFDSGGDAMCATVILQMIQDGVDLGMFSALLKEPSGAGIMREEFLEVDLPTPIGDGPHGDPQVQYRPYREAVVEYIFRVLWGVAKHPGDPNAFSVKWTVQYESGSTSGDKGGW